MIKFQQKFDNTNINYRLDHKLFAEQNLNYEILAKVLESAKLKHKPKVAKK